MTYQVDLDMTAPPDPTFVINSPPSLAGPMEFIPAACPGRFAEWDETVDLEWVDDGSARPTEGCGRLQSFTPGNIALIDRGSCEFYDKALPRRGRGRGRRRLSPTTGGSPSATIPTATLLVPRGTTSQSWASLNADGNPLRQLILVDGETVNATVGHATRPARGGWRRVAYGLGSHNDPDCPE